MTTLSITFPAGRYHGTPWGHHVNEGLVEWPPSPWRLLRALIAVGFAKQGWTALNALPPTARSLLESLAGELPLYHLPRGGVAHTRHFMPITEGKAQKTTKVLDTFLALADEEPLRIRYPVDLTPAQRDLLKDLLSGLSYLGRAESWTEAVLLPEDAQTDESWCRPLAEHQAVDPGWETVTALAPLPPAAYAAWRLGRVGPEPAKPAKKAGKKTAPELYPADLLACLGMDTTLLQKQGWSQPPGSRVVLYQRPAGALEPAVPAPRRLAPKPETVEAALLALSPDTVRHTVLPPMVRCLPQAEILHASLVRHLDRTDHPIVTGRLPDGSPALGHRHLHLLPLDLDGDHKLDHVLAWAPGGLDHLAQAAIHRLGQTWGKDVPRLVVTCAGMGDMVQMRQQLRNHRHCLPPELGLGPAGAATVWTSTTPYIAPRFTKAKGKHSIPGQIIAECASRDLPAPLNVEVLGKDALTDRHFLRFIRARRDGHPQPPSTMPHAVTITFPEPVTGPLCLGYGSHFGLGLFAAVT